jgi:hypothetical protein
MNVLMCQNWTERHMQRSRKSQNRILRDTANWLQGSLQCHSDTRTRAKCNTVAKTTLSELSHIKQVWEFLYRYRFTISLSKTWSFSLGHAVLTSSKISHWFTISLMFTIQLLIFLTLAIVLSTFSTTFRRLDCLRPQVKNLLSWAKECPVSEMLLNKNTFRWITSRKYINVSIYHTTDIYILFRIIISLYPTKQTTELCTLRTTEHYKLHTVSYVSEQPLKGSKDTQMQRNQPSWLQPSLLRLTQSWTVLSLRIKTVCVSVWHGNNFPLCTGYVRH